MTIEIIKADLSKQDHAEALIQLMSEYALDAMGGSQALSEFAKNNLVAELSKRNSAHVIIAFVDRNPAGLAICLEGFSTFACKPLLNIHDLIVSSSYRGQGLSKLILQMVEVIAFDLGCCKITLEVLDGNHVAKSAYKSFGFSGYELNPEMGHALFWEKKLLIATCP
jgi:ribosomal protein S18 acetylase RimI-like enzyme